MVLSGEVDQTRHTTSTEQPAGRVPGHGMGQRSGKLAVQSASESETVVTVQGPATDAGRSVKRGLTGLTVGEELTFGSCRCQDCKADVLVQAAPGQWLRGVLTVCADHWRLGNLSADTDLIGRNLEDDSQHLRIPPRRVDVVVPFELSPHD